MAPLGSARGRSSAQSGSFPRTGATRQHKVEDSTQRVEIRPPVDVIVGGRLLGGHVLRGSADGVIGGQLNGIGVGGQLDQSEVQDFGDVAFSPEDGHHDVGGFQVAMDQAAAVRLGRRSANLRIR